LKTLLFANRRDSALAPLTDTSCVALLSVACKPLIVHTVESLAMAKLTDLIVVVSSDADAVEIALGDGTRWGMRFEYLRTAAGESEERTAEGITDRLGDEYLVVRGEVLRTPIIADFLERSRSIGARSVVATIGGVDAGIRLVKSEERLPESVASRQDRAGLTNQDERRIDFPDARLSSLESLAAFHRASLDIVRGDFPGLIIPGRDVAPRVRVGRHAKFTAKAIKEVPVLIGSRCRISSTAELCGEVLVSNDVVVDRRAVIRSSVIMPNTYIGQLVEVTNAIVAGDRLIHVDTGTVATIVDSFLLARISVANRSFVRDLKWIVRACVALAKGLTWRSIKPSVISKVRTMERGQLRASRRTTRVEEPSPSFQNRVPGFGQSEPKPNTVMVAGTIQ
jgi:mannose-1-phosphate guanylyltransferase / phosphomannomutase